MRLARRWLAPLLLIAVTGLFAACGGDGKPDGKPDGAESPAPSGSVEPARPGGAGIASNPRPVRGLEDALILDDGLAMWNERPEDEDRTGVTSDTIKLGRYSGASGPTAAFESFWGTTLPALVERVNEAGGVHGRKLELLTRDDQFNPAVTVQVMQKLVEQDEIFALFMPVGNSSHQAVAEYEIEKGVPSLWHYDGQTHFLEPETTKTEFGGLLPDLLNGVVMADYIVSVKDNPRVAAIFQDDSTGKPAFDGFKFGIERAGGEITTAIGYDQAQSDMTAQARQAVDSDPDWIMYYGLPTQALNTVRALRETIGSDIPIILRGLLPVPGISQYMDGVTFVGQSIREPIGYPDNPVFPALEKLTSEEGAPFQAILTGLAYANFEHLVRALEMAGPDLTREGIVEAMESGFDGSWTCSICLAPTILGPQDHWTYEAARVQLWHEDTKSVEFLTDVLNYETSHGKGIRGNYPDFPCEEGTCPWKE